MARAPLHALQGFVTIARLGKLSAAADALHLTVSALSHQVRGLEERLGVRLFDRGPRGVRLTADGERLQQRIAPHLAAIEQALTPYRAGRDAVLHLSLLSSMANAWLVPRLGRFVARHPQIELNLDSSTALVDFERERSFDAALRYGRGRWPGLTAEWLFDDWIVPMASPELLARHPGRRDRPLDGLPLLGDPGSRWQEWFARFGGTPPGRFAASFSDAESLQRAAVEGLGVALGRLSLAQPLLDSGRLVTLCGDRLPSEYSHYLVHPPRSADHAGLRAFREWLMEEAAQYRAGQAASETM
jgi:LysR family transcriptional regulator, glycine cleavage system transcriptional activator